MTTSDEGSSGYLSKAQTLQLWDQIQQASAQAVSIYNAVYLFPLATLLSLLFLLSTRIFYLFSQHLQLLIQTCVVTRFEPSLVFLSQIAVQAIVSAHMQAFVCVCVCVCVCVFVYVSS